jgi:hypothetical protein
MSRSEQHGKGGTHQWAKWQVTAVLAPLLVCTFIFTAGCAERKARAATWRMVTQLHPRVPPRPAASAEPVVPPELVIAPPAAPQLSFARSSVPPRPRSSAPGGANAGDIGTAPPAAPLLSPQLTSEEQAAAQYATGQSLRIAEQNLRTTLGRNLSTTQADLAEKVRSFIAQAREAMRGGDWIRARNLAQKAELLSSELAKSL